MSDLSDAGRAKVEAALIEIESTKDEVQRLQTELVATIKDRESLQARLDSLIQIHNDYRDETKGWKVDRDEAVMKMTAIQTQMETFADQMEAVTKQLQGFCQKMRTRQTGEAAVKKALETIIGTEEIVPNETPYERR